ncbi:Bacterial leucyl aminopeptidase precursor [compost metagenome]
MKKLASLGVIVLLAACGGPSPSLQNQAGSPLAASSTSNPLDAAKAVAHVAYLTEPALAGRMTASEGDALANTYLVEQFRKLGLEVTLQPFTNSRFSGTAYNVIAVLKGSENPDRFVVVGAHKDHLGKRGNTIYFGANDNAGGTAAVLEIARVMSERAKAGQGPKSSVMFMAFSGEELGLIGSTHYTRNPIVPTSEGAKAISLKQIAGMVNLDCIAVGKTNTLGTDWVGTGAKSMDALSAIARRRGMTPYYGEFKVPHGERDHAHEELPPGASSDHAAFRKAGVRAICYYAEPVFSKYLHTPDDTLPERDRIPKAEADRFNPANLVRIGAIGLDTATLWANE